MNFNEFYLPIIVLLRGKKCQKSPKKAKFEIVWPIDLLLVIQKLRSHHQIGAVIDADILLIFAYF
jgi:hypothetical protein